jgi:hypothetical protein
MDDLVGHIRTVHFTVMVVAFVLIAALQVEKKRPLERASTDAETILQMTEQWDEITAAITKDLDSHANRKSEIVPESSGTEICASPLRTNPSKSSGTKREI